MGLLVSHGCYDGSYSTFNKWRNIIAVTADYKLIKKKGHLINFEYEAVDLPYEQYQQKNYYGFWDKAPDDPLIMLFVHSDCEGVIQPHDADQIAEHLEQLTSLIMDAYYQNLTQKFIDGLRHAANNHETIIFS